MSIVNRMMSQPNIRPPTYSDKFVAFIDVLGFSAMVEASEHSPHLLPNLLEIVSKLASGTERSDFEAYGPTLCPQADHYAKNLDFCSTQVSDCVVISAEASPAGLINLVNHCFGASIRLLQIGVLCRGFITRGLIYHTPTQFIGPGYLKAVSSEKTVSAFRNSIDDRGTPFIEIDDSVASYAYSQTDKCVGMMFDRLTKFDGERLAIFPFRRLTETFDSADPEKNLESIGIIRDWITQMRKQIETSVAGAEKAAVKKGPSLSGCARRADADPEPSRSRIQRTRDVCSSNFVWQKTLSGD